MRIESHTYLPVEVVFNANWWHANYGIDFGRDFFFDPDVRVASECTMRQALFHRFGDIGLGEENAVPRPVIYPVHLACGFLVQAMWGCEVVFAGNNTPQVLPLKLSIEEINHLDELDFESIPIFREFTAMMDALEARFGYLVGDVGWSSLQNLGLDLMGQDLFEAYYEAPEVIDRLYDVLARTSIRFVNYIRSRTGTSSISVNRSVAKVDPTINLQSNCSVQMISNAHYERFLLKPEQQQARELQPYGIHHCGNNMHAVADGYAKVPDACFFDVGWGADIKVCREKIPDAFFNIRLSPVKLQQCMADEVESDLVALLEQAGELSNVGICCINMEHDTPDENIRRMFEVANRFRHAGG